MRWGLYVFLRGLREGYPPCCVLRFAFDECRDGDGNPCFKRGIRFPRTGPGQWIPCGWFHKAHLVAGPDADPHALREDHMVRIGR